MQTLRGLLLDLDGTFLDSNDAHALSWVDAFEASGIQVPFEKVRKLIGMGGDKLLREAAGLEESSNEGQEISARRASLFVKQYLPSLRPFPGGRDLLQRALERGLRLVVATSATGGELEKLLRQAQIEDLIDKAATSSDAERSKPDPDIVEAAILRSGLRAGELLMIGDTPYDVAAAKRAGVDTVAVCSGGWKEQELRGAVAVYEDVRALHRDFDHSPLAARA